MTRALRPGALADRLASLAVAIDGLAVELAAISVTGYYDGARRPTGIAVLSGAGEQGRGECVAWTPREQNAFAAACARLDVRTTATIGEVSLLLGEELDDPYHRAAVEGAAIDLALRQGDTNPFRLSGRAAEPVAFCWSIGHEADPLSAIGALLERNPDARIKIDVPASGWSAVTWEALARTRRIVVLDFKRESDLDQVRLAHASIPEAWLEDPPAQAVTLDQGGDWLGRVSLDGYVLAAVDLDDPEIPPAAVNVKAPRVGGWIEALRCLEECRHRELHAYVGGMFEVDVGRSQARVLASLYTAAAWNDLAPLADASVHPLPSSPIDSSEDFIGFAPD
ncbi:MAG TPA: hypothetical protein VEY33_04610 [Gemmatimonadota bacterium]|nr:hypothetical protein [Gemmatimonadota bacterium]